MRIPSSTYRVQLNAGFTFDNLAELAPYLRHLGVGDCYCSPIFLATRGSLHGYDVCDYTRINPELGGEDGLRRLAIRLRQENLGLLLDFVPNHMGIEDPRNRWWRDVLEHGPGSAHASFFDIHWEDRAEPEPARRRVFSPVLPDHYGVLLEQGKIRLVFEDGELLLAHEAQRFPLRPETHAEIIRRLPSGSAVAPTTDNPKRHLAELAASADVRAALDELLRSLNGTPGQPSSFDELDALIESQHYRLARWQAGAHGTNYRRFFAIDTLVGLRVEDPRVFEAVHERLGELIRDGAVTGLRIDHIDGLKDPEAYLQRLRRLASDRGKEPFIVVEKILAADEQLPAAWPVQGTTGYEFIASLNSVLTNARHEAAFDTIYSEFIGKDRRFAAVVAEKKRLVLEEMFANTVATLAQELQSRLRIDRRWRDLTVTELGNAVRALLAGFRVYRTYRRESATSSIDRQEIDHASEAALRDNPRIEPAVIRFVRDVLRGDYPEGGASEAHRAAMTDWVLTFQQYTGAVTAKAVEDTTFYTCNRLIAHNEVGCSPNRFGGTVAEFHAANERRVSRSPLGLLTTSTHDTKVSEDVRARLFTLSEIPDEWSAWLREWRELNAGHKSAVGGREAPDADEEYRLYQTLLGAWPLPPGDVDDDFRERIVAYMGKAQSEAKTNTSALHPDKEWENAGERFVRAILAPGGAFIQSCGKAAARLARPGMLNSLAQVILKLTAPGVPDIYQGNESWNFSLVDPDNRRPVDHVALQKLAAESTGRPLVELLAHWETGGIKWELTRRLLHFRRAHPALFETGDYRSLKISGPRSAHALAFMRKIAGQHMLVIVPRLVAHASALPVGEWWRETAVSLPDEYAGGLRWRDLLSDKTHPPRAAPGLRDLFSSLPFCVLHRAQSQPTPP